MKRKTIRILKIIFGTFLLALSVEMFVIPYKILSGGVAGIAVAFQPFFRFNETIFANVLTVGFLIWGLLAEGKSFVMDSVLSSLCYPIFTTLTAGLGKVTHVPPSVAAIYAGLLGGIGIGLVMSTGASTGGVDIPTMIFAKTFHIKINTMVMIVDGLTVFLGFVAYGLSDVLIGLLSVFATTYAVGKVLYAGQTAAKSVQILSDHWEVIMSRIQMDLNRGVTVLDTMGGFSAAHKKMLLCVVSERQYGALMEIVHAYDDKAFVITTDASDMHGEGFSYPAPRM